MVSFTVAFFAKWLDFWAVIEFSVMFLLKKTVNLFYFGSVILGFSFSL